MEQIDLKQLVEQYPEVLTDGTKLKAYILDLYPQCKRGMVNILVAIQQCGIVSEMQASKSPSALDMSRWKKVLDDDYGFAGRTAETCLQMWCSAVGVQLEIKVSVETKPNKPNDNIPPKIKEKADEALALRDSQNSQKDWYEYSGTTLLRYKKEYQEYDGVIHIPDGVTNVGDFAFSGCTGLTSITIPDSVESIGVWAFEGCTGLTSITIPDSVMSTGYDVFKDCTGLTSITIGNSVTSTGHSEFSGCTGLAKITIPNNVTSIGGGTFYGCTGLISITIPDSVTNIGRFAFYGCERLKEIWYTSGKERWKTIKKEHKWKGNTGSYTVHCTDGDIPKNES